MYKKVLFRNIILLIKKFIKQQNKNHRIQKFNKISSLNDEIPCL